jgi:hypothetical protein
VLSVLVTIALSFQCTWAGPEKKVLSSKIGPLLNNDILDSRKGSLGGAGDTVASDKDALEVSLTKVIVVMNRKHLEPLPEPLIAELKVRVEGLGGHIGDHAFNNVQAWIPIEKIEGSTRISGIHRADSP